RRPEAAPNNGRRRQAVPGGEIDARRRPEAAIENAGRRAEAATNGRRQAEAAHRHKDARRRPGADINGRRRRVAIVAVGQLVGGPREVEPVAVQDHVDQLAQLFYEQQRLLVGLCRFQAHQLTRYLVGSGR
ncbi:unnamed protein product, partial [Callosobruchus maculatus]